MTENKRFIKVIDTELLHSVKIKDNGVELTADEVADLLNKQEETIQDLLKYKYLVKALEEVSGSHYIEEIISDYTDGAVSDEKEQLELGKWHSEHGLSWEDGDME